MPLLEVEDLRIIDCDTHLNEAPDLWTSRAPAKYKERVPHIETVNGQPTWIVDGAELGFARAAGVVNRDGQRVANWESKGKGLDWIHPAAYDNTERIKLMDESGVYAQVLFPNVIGLGGQTVNRIIKDPELRRACVEIYNDAHVERFEESDGRLIGMALMPAWDVAACVKEAQRVAALGLRGINMTVDPSDLGSPDLGSRVWDPLWEVCADRGLPVHFHIGSSNSNMDFHLHGYWPSIHPHVQPAIGTTMLFINSAKLLINATLSGMFDRFPTLQMVLAESGIGYIPFMLDAMDWELLENAPEQYAEMTKKPSEYFRSNFYATFWFESNQGDLQHLVDKIGDDRILFETDFPHPTCLYPAPLDAMADRMNSLRPESRRRIMGENAAKLYRL